VLAQVGDQMGDFVDRIDYAADGTRNPPAERTRLAQTLFAPMWGERWFLIANPMYGRWNEPPLTLDDAVPPAARWTLKE
jgi:predicted secreted acid phosphatase